MAKITWGNWRDNLKEASFRGIPFKVLTSSVEGGRRSVLHQYPFSEEPYLEDMGKEAGVYHIVGYVVQNIDNDFDYFDERDALKEALEAEGAGTLVHPFYGELNVGVFGKYKLDESAVSDGGVARFTIVFVDAGKSKEPSGVVDQTSAADAKCDAAQTSIWNKFGNAYNVVNQAAFVVTNALAQAQSFISAIQNILMLPNAALGSIISSAISTAATINSTIATVINLPSSLASTMQNSKLIFSSLISSVSKHDTSLVTTALSLTTFGSSFPAISATTPDRAVELANQNQIIDTVRCFGLIEGLRAAIYVDYASYEDAANMMNTLSDAFDSVLSSIGQNSQDDDLFDTISDLKPFMVQAMIAKGANLPSIRSITLPSDPAPSMVEAYALYNDITRDQEIIDRNPAVMLHPGFPLAGEVLKVLSE